MLTGDESTLHDSSSCLVSPKTFYVPAEVIDREFQTKIHRRWSGQSQQYTFYAALGGRGSGEKVGGWEKCVVRGIGEMGR